MENNPKILVTGASRMLGFAIVKELVSQGKSVRVLVNKNTEFSIFEQFKNSVHIVFGNLLDIVSLEDATIGIEEIYHADDFISFLPKDRLKLYDINITGTKNIVNVALSFNVKKLLFVSSTLAFGTYSFKKEINEKTKWVEHDNNSFYSISKQRAELEIYRANVEGIETVIVNPSLMIGNTINKKSFYNLKNIANKNYRFYPKGINGFVGVIDVAKVSIKLMSFSIQNCEKYIVSSENLDYKYVLRLLNSKMSKKNIFDNINYIKLSLMFKLNWLRSMLFGDKVFLTKEIYNFHNKEFKFDNTKTIKELDFQFESIDLVIDNLEK